MMAAPYAIAAAPPRPALPAPPTLAAVPAWHSLLEERWQQRLSTIGLATPLVPFESAWATSSST